MLRLADNPALAEQIGHDIVTASGKTLLGADNKAGVAEIVTAAAYLIAHPEIPHGPICSFRTPGGQRIAVYELTRPAAAKTFEGRRDF